MSSKKIRHIQIYKEKIKQPTIKSKLKKIIQNLQKEVEADLKLPQATCLEAHAELTHAAGQEILPSAGNLSLLNSLHNML